MNRIDTSLIVDPSKQQPFLGTSLQFLQSATLSGLTFVLSGVYNRIPNLSNVVLGGLTKTGNVIADGIFGSFFSGETFLVTGADTTSYANAPMLVPDNNFDFTIDPVTFSDGSTDSVHQTRKYKVADVSSGGFLYSSLVFLQTTPVAPTLSGGYTSSGTLPLAYYKDNQKNRVHLKGILQGGYTTGTAWTLPTGYRPTVNKRIGIHYTYDGTTGTTFVEINTSGVVRITDQVSSGTAYVYYLDEVSFFTEW